VISVGGIEHSSPVVEEQRKAFRSEWEWPASVRSDSTDELISDPGKIWAT